ncbi:tetratricopeptide repeat protein [Methanosarcina sp. DH2]|nr:tetratricopeptide repeat protein [Methanosarcina sp. DH2]
MDLVALAQQATDILVPALSALCIAGKPASDRGKEVLVDMIYEKAFEKLGSEGGKRAQAILEKISPRMSESFEKALTKVSRDSEDPKAKEELQQEILKLLRENPELAREIEFTINLNVENVDQFAVGNYNNFFNFETPSGDEFIKIIEYLDQKRKEAVNQEILTRYNPSTLPKYPNRLKEFVTENRSEELIKALTYLENHQILLISGVGGVGKSTLARALVDLRPVNVPEPFWFSFYDNQDAKLGDILEKIAAYMNAPEIVSFKAERREPGKTDVDKLTGELHRRSEIWLIFDDLSTILEDQHFADKGIELIFSSLRYNTHNAKVIVTSRILPILENGESLIDRIEDEEKQHLNGLRKDFAVDYLAGNGLDKVEPEKLEELATGVDGHPLALKLLVELVKEFGVKDTLEDLSMYQESKDDTIKKARKLFDKLAGEEKELLERVSVYRGSVGLEGLKEVFTENTPKNAVRKLIDKSLLETNHNSSYWLHPLVQEFSYDDLENKKEAHMLAVKYYLLFSLPKNPTKKEYIRSAIEAHYHACKAEEYDLAANIIWMYNLPDLLDLWGNSRTLIEIYEKLLPKDHFKDETLLNNRSIHGFILGNLGSAHSNLGEPRKAIKYSEQALKFVRETGNKREEGVALVNIGNEYCHLGKPKKTIEYYEQALKILRGVEDRRAEGNLLGNLGNAHSDLRESRKAIEYYEQALRIAKETEDRRAEGYLLGNLGNAYNDLGETRTAIEYFEQAISILREMGARRGEENHLGNLGNAYRRLGKPRKAIEYYEKALNISREIGDQRGEGNHLGRLGVVYSDLREQRKAIDFLKQSLAIGKTIEDPRIIRLCEKKLKELEGAEG